jgi:AcrR family transcriptional regulator
MRGAPLTGAGTSRYCQPMDVQTKPLKPPRRKQEDRSAATRARILEACIQSLFEEGYGSASMVRICERADVSRGAMLNQFPTKADLMLAVLAELYRLQMIFIGERADEIPDPVVRFRELLHITWQAQNRPIGFAILEILVGTRSDPSLTADFGEKIRPIVGQTSAFVDRYAEGAALELDEDDRDLVHILGLSMRGLMIEALINPGVDSARLIARLSAICERDLTSRIRSHNRDAML